MKDILFPIITATLQAVFTELPRSDEHRRRRGGNRRLPRSAPEAILHELPGLLAAEGDARPQGQAFLHELPRHAGRPGTIFIDVWKFTTLMSDLNHFFSL